MPANKLATRILIGLIGGIFFGMLLRFTPVPAGVHDFIVNDVLNVGGDIFIKIMKMIVVPVVFVSLVCGVSSLKDMKKLGRMGSKTFLLYIATTAFAIALALLIAHLLHIGVGVTAAKLQKLAITQGPSIKDVLLNIVPSNPIKALVDGEMLQIILFSILLGVAINKSSQGGERLQNFFEASNKVIMRLINMVMQLTPYGVFCLLGKLIAVQGFSLILHLLGYFCTVLLVLFVHLGFSYTMLLKLASGLSPWVFLRKMRSAMLFAFSLSSSNASIPIVLETVEEGLGVEPSLASFVIPLGATINMDGTAIMQGVATVFIANIYHVAIGFTGYLTIILMATLASIGTAGVPGVGMITLTMVLQQVGLPVEGIAMIIGVDRLLDMVRTAVNITGDSVIACVVAKSENSLDTKVFYQ